MKRGIVELFSHIIKYIKLIIVKNNLKWLNYQKMRSVN